MSITFGLEIGRALCTALGLNADEVSDLTLRISVHEPASLTITKLVSSEDGEGIVSVVERYGLTELVENGWEVAE